MRKTVNLFFLFLFIPFLVYSSSVKDSLQTLLKTSSIEEQIPIYLKLVELSRGTSLADTDKFIDLAVKLSEQTEDPSDNITVLLTLAEIKQNNGNYIETYNILQSCLELSTKRKLTESRIETLIQFSIFYSSLSEFEKANSLLEKALELNSNANNTTNAHINFYSGLNHLGLDNNYDALSSLKKASYIYKSINDSVQYVRALINTGKAYMDIDDYETAMKIDYEALAISQKIGDVWAASLAYTNIAWNYFKLDDFEKSLEYNLKSLELRNLSKNKHATISSLINIGVLFKNYNKTEEALNYLNKARILSEESKYFSAKMNRKRCYYNLYEVYKSRGDFKNSLQYFKSYNTLSDSINGTIRNDELKELQAKQHIKTFINEQQIKEEIQRQKNIFMLFISLIVFLIVSYIAYDKFKKRNLQNQQLKKEIYERIKTQDSLDSKNKRLELMNRILRHDLANGLAVIQSGLNIFFAEKDEKILKEIYKRNQMLNELIYDISDFERFMTSNPDLSIFKISDLIKEISPKFNVEINIKNSCNFSAIKTIATVFNNIIENAISHGKATKIEISCETRNNYCDIRIANNGKDIPPKIISRIFNEGFKHGKSANTGMGLSIVKKAMEQSMGSVSVKANKPQGAVFVLTFRKSI